MTARQALHRLLDDLPDSELPVAARLLESLKENADPVLRALLTAPLDAEPAGDDFDGGLTEARRELAEGKGVAHADVMRELRLS